MLQSQEQSFTVPPDSIALGDIAVCDTLNEFIIYTLDNLDYVKVDPTAVVVGTFTSISVFDQQGSFKFTFNNANQAGTFPLTNFWAGQINVPQPPQGLSTNVTTAAANIGDIIEGTFDGSFLDVFGLSHTISGTYRVVRDQ